MKSNRFFFGFFATLLLFCLFFFFFFKAVKAHEQEKVHIGSALSIHRGEILQADIGNLLSPSLRLYEIELLREKLALNGSELLGAGLNIKGLARHSLDAHIHNLDAHILGLDAHLLRNLPLDAQLHGVELLHWHLA